MADNKTDDSDFMKKVEILQMQRDFYKSLLDSLPFTVFAKNKKGEYVYANKFCNEINGFKNDELIGKTDKDIVKEINLVADFAESDRTVLEDRKGFARLMPLYINQEFVYQYLMKEPLRDPQGNFAGITGAVLPQEYGIPQKLFDNKEGILFDYILESGKIIILREHPDFPAFSQPNLTIHKLLKSDTFFEDTGRVLDNAVSHSIVGDVPIHLMVKLFDKNKRLRFCDLTLSCFFDKDNRPFRVSGILTPLEEEKIVNEQLKIETENAKRMFALLGKNHFDIAIYVNSESNYYYVIHAVQDFSKIKVTGTINELLRELMGRFCTKDVDVLKGMSKAISNTRYYPRNFNLRKFRFSNDKGKLKWKSYRIDRFRKEMGDGFIFSISDVNDIVRDISQKSGDVDYINLIDMLATVIEFRNLESGEHISRVRQFTKILLNFVNRAYENVNFTEDEIEDISIASSFHDLGKITIPDGIILKPGKLTEEEFEVIKTHTLRGAELLESLEKNVSDRVTTYAKVICLYHHERWDGKGYPNGLKEDEIPIEAQVVALADVFDALTSERCYKKPYDYDTAFEMILKGDCGVFSPKLLECFKKARHIIVEHAKLSRKELI